MTFGDLFQDYGGKVLAGLATAAFVGAGVTVVDNKISVTRLDQRMEVVYETSQTLKETNRQLQSIATQLALLIDREEQRRRDQSSQ